MSGVGESEQEGRGADGPSRAPRGARQPGAPAAAAGLGGLDPRRLGVPRRARRLRVRRGWSGGGRPGRPDPARARRARGAVHRLARRPLLARRRDGRERPAPVRPHAGGRGDDRGGRAGAARLRPRRALDDLGHGLPTRAGCADPRARALAVRADGGERRVEHARERRHVPGPGARWPAPRRLEPRGRLRRERRELPLVGVPRHRPAALRAAARGTGRPAASAAPAC